MSKPIPSVRVLPTEQYFSLVRQQLAETGQAFVRVTGVSMQPLLRHLRDGVVLESPRRLRRGDIVLFDRLNGRYALHRVIRVGKNGFTMAGDNQWHVEKDLPFGQVVGVAVALERKGRRIPCENFFLKMYSRAVTALTFPRIYLRKAAGKLFRLFRRQPGKGARA